MLISPPQFLYPDYLFFCFLLCWFTDYCLSQTEAIDEAAKIKYPLNLAATALQLFQLAALKGLEDEAEISLVRIWDGSGEAFFPQKS